MTQEDGPSFYSFNKNDLLSRLGKETLLTAFEKMIAIRQFETRAEAAYTAGKMGGFFHAYIGQEAIQTAILTAAGPDHWYIDSYRCHALALLLGESPDSLMAELYGKATGNTHGRGGSMHLFSKNMLGGFGIVGGQIPIATGAAFSCKYQKQKGRVAFCFLGDGTVPQGTFHESLNLASLRKLPCLYVIENNQWSMGTPLERTLANYPQFTYFAAKAYGIPHYKLDGMDFFSCYAGIKDALKTVLDKETPVLIECNTERFKGHSISDPGLYRTREQLKECMKRDPILLLKKELIDAQFLTEELYKEIDARQRKIMTEATESADQAPWPETNVLEQGVFAQETRI